jgi:hypothetical protein
MATKKKTPPILKESELFPGQLLVIENGALVGIIGSDVQPSGTLFFPGSYRCVDQIWRKPIDPEAHRLYSEADALEELVRLAELNEGRIVVRPKNHFSPAREVTSR